MVFKRFISRPLAERLTTLSKRNDNGCLIFTGQKTRAGYGRILDENGKRVSAHRAAYYLAHGEIPEGMNVCHRCDVRLCVEPSHLFLGTHADNHADMVAKNRHHRPKGSTHGMAKITEADARAIYLDQRPAAAIAADFGIWAQMVYRIRAGLNWTHATADLRSTGSHPRLRLASRQASSDEPS